MERGGFTAEVSNLSPSAAEEDVYEFFSYCGEVDHVEIMRWNDQLSTAYVIFREANALETATLLSGARILDQTVCICKWDADMDVSVPLRNYSAAERSSSSDIQMDKFVSTPGEAVTVAQQVVKTMIAKGYVLSKDALSKAKAFDESHQVSSSAAAKVAELSKKVGLTDKIYSGIEVIKSVDERYHVSDMTRTAASYTGRTAVSAANTVVNSSYFAKGALWVSDILDRASKAAANLGNKGIDK